MLRKKRRGRGREEGKKNKNKKQLGKIQQITTALFLFLFQRQHGGPVGWAPVMLMWVFETFTQEGEEILKPVQYC